MLCASCYSTGPNLGECVATKVACDAGNGVLFLGFELLRLLLCNFLNRSHNLPPIGSYLLGYGQYGPNMPLFRFVRLGGDLQNEPVTSIRAVQGILNTFGCATTSTSLFLSHYSIKIALHQSLKIKNRPMRLTILFSI